MGLWRTVAVVIVVFLPVGCSSLFVLGHRTRSRVRDRRLFGSLDSAPPSDSLGPQQRQADEELVAALSRAQEPQWEPEAGVDARPARRLRRRARD